MSEITNKQSWNIFAEDDYYSSSQRAKVNNLGSYEIYSLQKSDIEDGDSMLDVTFNTLYKYSDYTDSNLLSSQDSFLNYGFDNSVTKNNTRVTLVGTSNSEIQSTYSKIYAESEYIRNEKSRISSQSGSKHFHRADHFAIGTVYLEIPPTQISVSDEAHNYRFGSLRSPGEVVLTSGRATTRIDLEIVFNGLDDINNKLRPLLAQFKTTPFLPIESEYLRAILNPFDRKLVDLGQLESKKIQLHEMQRREKTLDDLISVSSESNQKTSEMMEVVDKMRQKGWIDADFKTALIQGEYLINPDNIPPEELTDGDYIIDKNGNKRVSLKKFIARHMEVSAPKSPDMIELTRNLNDIDELNQEIADIKAKSKELNIKNAEEMFTDRQLMCVLSQMAISTMPGFVEALGCKLSLFVFNYDPFSIDCAFISGYNKNAATPDITKCDLFIDWYTTRWLAERNDPDRPSLGWFTGDQTTKFEYVTKLDPIDENNISKDIIQTESIDITAGISITGISVSIKNIIQFLPILSCKNPTCQYMGSLNSDVQFMMESTDENKVKELSKMVDRVRSLSRTNNRVTRNNFILIKNNFLQFLAMPYFTINDYGIDTVPGSPGLQSVALSLIEFKPGQENLQDLSREGVTNQDELVWTAQWMLKKAHDFITTGGTSGTNSQYGEIYDQVMDPDVGWFRKGNTVVSRFMSGIGGETDENKSIRMKVRSRMELTTSAIAQESAINEVLFHGQLLLNPEKAIDYDLYSSDFTYSLSNVRGDDSFFVSELDTMSRVIAVMQRDDLVRRILQISRNPEINEGLNKNRKKEDLDAGKKYCYPDLELPRYGEIPDGFRFINTDVESGKQGSDTWNPKPAQSDFAMVDPDFFFYKGSLWGKLDNSNDMYNAVKSGISTYEKLAFGNYYYRKQVALSEGLMQKFLYNRQQARLEDTEVLLKEPIEDLDSGETIDGKWVDVVRVVSGNEIVVRDGKKEYPIVLEGYSLLPDGNSAAALSSYVYGKKIRIDLGTKKTDENKKYLAQIMVKDNNEYKNVNSLMLSRAKELNLARNPSAYNPLAAANDRDFFLSHDNYLRVARKKTIEKLVYSPLLVQNIIADYAGGIGFAVGGVAATALTASEKEAESKIRDSIGLVAVSAGYVGDIFPESKMTNDIGALPGRGLFAPTPNNGVKRFDKEATEHISLIAERIRQSQKDNTLRMSRAFPTFKVYFIEEDMPEWGRWDDKYDYRAIASIDITKSRAEAADVAVVRFFNTRGTLDREYFGLHSADGKYLKREPQEAVEAVKQETREEQDLEEFILKPGTVIKIKMGYSSDPDLLDTVFTGMIAEVSGGDIIEVVAQGFGVELLIPVPKPAYKVYAASAYKILDRIVKNPAIKHFGKTKWFAESSDTTKVLFRRSVPDPKNPGRFRGASWWRNIGGFRHVLGVRDDSRDNNIWVPENSWLYNQSHGGSQTLITKDKTIWDMFRDMMRRMPGYITTVLPFDNRATIYFGPADFLYWATNEAQDQIRNWKINYKRLIDRPDDEKIKEMIDSGEMEYISPEEMNKKLDKLGAHVTSLKSNVFLGGKITNYLAALNGTYSHRMTAGKYSLPTPIININLSSLGYSSSINYFSDSAASFAELVAQSDLSDTDNSAELSKLYDFTSRVIRARYDGVFQADGSLSGPIRIRYIGKDGVYVKKDGTIYLEPDSIKWYNDIRKLEHDESSPSRRLVRQYHYKDSFHHIISNSIVATSQYLSNKVTVEYGNEVTTEEKRTKSSSPNFQKVSAQVDDDIWPERVKEKIVQEKNANTVIVAWNYALGNLWEEMRKMYSGHLVMLGDPTIRPYDLVMMSDYFTEMYGPVEVEQVVHHFSPDTGFVTTIVPNLVCHVNNSMQKGSLTVAGAYMDSTTDFVERVQSAASFYGLLGGPGAWFGNQAANVAFWMSGLSQESREPVSFSPLMYAGRPFIAGVEGMRKTSLYEAISGNIERFIIQRNKVQETIGEIWDTARKFVGSSLQE